MYTNIKFLAVFIMFSNTAIWSQEIKDFKLIYDFENPIKNSPANCNNTECKIEILPGLFANESKSTSRVYLESKSPIKDKASLGFIPIANFNPEIEIKLNSNISNLDSIKFNFVAKSLKNGNDSDTKYAKLFYSISYNKGVSYDESIFLANFYNTNSKESKYEVTIPALLTNAENIAIKLLSKRSTDSSGSCAKIIIDDLTFELLLDKTLSNDNLMLNQSIINKMTPNNIVFNNYQTGKIFNKLGQLITTFNDVKELDMSTLHPDYYLIYCNSTNNCFKFLKN